MSSHSTPSRSSKSTSTSKLKSPFSKAGRSSPPSFTPAMQDRQARNKDPYSSSDESSENSWGHSKRFDMYGNDTYENVQRRREAAVILDNPELLMMHSQARSDSIPATRQYFTKLLCGYYDDKDSYSAPLTKQQEEKLKLKPFKASQGLKKKSMESMD